MVNSIQENLQDLERAAKELAVGFARVREMPRAEQVAALCNASATLIEMRRATDNLVLRVR